MINLKGKVALIVGATASVGIGGATAQKLADQGAALVLADINLDGASALAERITGEGGDALAVHLDLGEEDSVKAMVDVAMERFGKIDIAHLNAADTRVRQRDTDAVDVDIEVFDQTLLVGLRGYFLCTRFIVPAMLRGGGGSIIYTSSDAAILGTPNHVAYQTSKAGVSALMRHVATRWGKERIRANAISPGLVLTDTVMRDHTEQSQAMFLSMTKSHRLGQAEDIAGLVAFLASDEASWINGQVYSINGGLLMR